MKVSGISALACILAPGSCATGSYSGSSYGNKTVTVTSTVTAPSSTVTATVTVTAPASYNNQGATSYGSSGGTIVGGGGSKSYIPASSTYIGPPSTYVGNSKSGAIAPPYVATSGTVVTSVDYSYKATSVWVYPVGSSPTKDCTVAIYEETTVTVVVININITIINGQATTICSTISGQMPTTTPPIPAPPTTYSQPPTSTSVWIPGGGYNGTMTQSKSAGSTSTSTPGGGSNSTKVHNVVVGAEGKLLYKDNQIIASIGDIIRFDFNSTNHTVTQSTLQKPCEPLKDGFDTGFTHFNNQSRTGVLPTVDFVVSVSTPLWFYCAQPKGTHCQKGMVLGINPGTKFPEFLSAATASTGFSKSTGTPSGTGAYGTGKTSSSSPSASASKSSTISGSAQHPTTSTTAPGEYQYAKRGYWGA
ncbi:putative GPI-anchored cupredoxin [Lachnellula hyalina]|uniref:Putative GPI-anchored cupredoxin n=1 Tax=Lachnellula hyalina TaxID=1316788 RepID=A0A8H8TXL0_9HELO|nr:putative GPI-anchored cupredoxin [Lachnellula hyalina]TVY25617.1 putative GPI-anchored cupredoxin [Lachnellula hyalina]